MITLLLITPLFAGAAGFAKESLFLSKTPVTEGETVFIHTVVRNDAAAAFSGEVIFKNGETRVGAVSVNLASGGADAVSVSWQPSVGTHTVTAELTATDGIVSESESATFVVNAKPSATTATSTSTSVESSEDLQNKLAGISPQAASAAKPVFATIDTLREKGVAALEAGEQWAKTKTSGQVAGADTESSGIANTVMTLVATFLAYVFVALKWLLSSAAIFYPVFVIVFFYLLWRLYKRMRRPSYG